MEKPKTEKSGIRPGVIVAVMAVLGLLVAGRMLGRLGTAKKKNDDTTPGTVATTIPPRPGSPGALAPGATAALNGHAASPATTVASIPGVPAAAPGSTEPVADWSAKLDDILGSNDDEAKKADLLLAMWKNLPEDGQVEIMQHISNLLPDEKFSALAQTFTNAATPEAVLDIIMTDTLNRPNGIKLPVLLDVARTPGHPKAEEARDILEVFVDADHGTDWAKWEKAVNDWLKENPDEPEVTN
jgi:hypothetical protein